MQYDCCLICDGDRGDPPIAFIQGFPICSQECKEEWDNLTPQEKERYIQCTRAINASDAD